MKPTNEQAIELFADVRDAYAALEEIAALGTIPFEDIKRELGI